MHKPLKSCCCIPWLFENSHSASSQRATLWAFRSFFFFFFFFQTFHTFYFWYFKHNLMPTLLYILLMCNLYVCLRECFYCTLQYWYFYVSKISEHFSPPLQTTLTSNDSYPRHPSTNLSSSGNPSPHIWIDNHPQASFLLFHKRVCFLHRLSSLVPFQMPRASLVLHQVAQGTRLMLCCESDVELLVRRRLECLLDPGRRLPKSKCCICFSRAPWSSDHK